jgi:hypothetical protein
MTRITFIGTCLAALVATAMFGAAATEAAGTPEWYECIKAKGVGTYEKGCAKEGGAGGYVARPGIGTGSFVIQGKGKVVLRGANGTPEVTCDHLAIRGTKEMPDLLTGVSLDLSLCGPGTKPRGSSCEAQEEGKGASETGTIEGEPLAGELGYISRSPVRVGLKLASAADPGGIVIPRVVCKGDPHHRRWSGSFVGEVGGAVNIANKKATVNYLPGPYLGEIEPGVTPDVDQPLEGEAAGGLLEESQPKIGAPFESPTPVGIEGLDKVTGEQMIKA